VSGSVKISANYKCEGKNSRVTLPSQHDILRSDVWL